MSRLGDVYEKDAGTVLKLHDFLGKLIRQGRGKSPITFDTEAREFKYHLAKVGSASWIPKKACGPAVILHEERTNGPA